MTGSADRSANLTPMSFRAKALVRKLWMMVRQPRTVERDRLVVVDDDASAEPPIFLIGLHRSGTTVVRQIVDSHSRIACPPETYFLQFLSAAADEKNFGIGLEQMGLDRSQQIAGLRRAVDFYFRAYCAGKDKPRWAEKTPHYVEILPFIEELYGPTCPYVMIFRHPLDVANSLLNKGWDFIDYGDDPLGAVCDYIRDGLERQLGWIDAHPERCFSVHYERLVSEPAPLLRGMFEFVGEPWEEAVLNFNDMPHDQGTGDPEAQVLRGFRPSLSNWRGWKQADIDTAWQRLGDLPTQLGYGLDPDQPLRDSPPVLEVVGR
ncbi:MAG: sulfotransferase [Planctomycetota bacterium]